MRHMRRSFFAAVLAGLAAAALYSAPAIAQEPGPPHAPMSLDYANYINAVLQMNIAGKQAEAVRHANLPKALESCAGFSDAVAQSICALAAAGVFNGAALASPASGSGPGPGLLAIAGPPAPQAVERPLNWWEALIRAPAALFQAAVQIAPALAQYKVGVATVRSQEKIAVAHAAERTSLYNVFGGMHRDGVGAVRDTSLGAFGAFAQIPAGHNTTITVDGSHGINFGSGALTYNPIINSHNPVTTHCTGGQAGAGGGTTVPGPGGPGGSASC
jgi:hypothetical protein